METKCCGTCKWHMTAERAIELLSSGAKMPRAQHSAAELDEACRMACDALRLYTPRIEVLDKESLRLEMENQYDLDTP